MSQDGNVPSPSSSETYTLDEAMAGMGLGKCQMLMILFAGLAWTADAMETMLLSFIGPEVHCLWGISGAQVRSRCGGTGNERPFVALPPTGAVGQDRGCLND